MLRLAFPDSGESTADRRVQNEDGPGDRGDREVRRAVGDVVVAERVSRAERRADRVGPDGFARRAAVRRRHAVAGHEVRQRAGQLRVANTIRLGHRVRRDCGRPLADRQVRSVAVLLPLKLGSPVAGLCVASTEYTPASIPTRVREPVASPSQTVPEVTVAIVVPPLVR